MLQRDWAREFLPDAGGRNIRGKLPFAQNAGLAVQFKRICPQNRSCGACNQRQRADRSEADDHRQHSCSSKWKIGLLETSGQSPTGGTSVAALRNACFAVSSVQPGLRQKTLALARRGTMRFARRPAPDFEDSPAYYPSKTATCRVHIE